MRRFFLVAAWGLALSMAGQWAAGADEIISESAAQRGLTRAWVSQAEFNSGQGRLQSLVLHEGVLYAQSDRATLEAIDAETGRKIWSKMIGRPGYQSVTPAIYRDLLATLNGPTLFILNRYTGDILYQTTVEGALGGGPALSGKRAYVPMLSGTLLAYRLDPVTDPAGELGKLDLRAKEMSAEEKKDAAARAEEERRENIRIRRDDADSLACGSSGRIMVAPTVTSQNREEEYVSWVTDRGFLYVGRIDRRSNDSFFPKYRVGAKGKFNSPPSYLPPSHRIVGDSGVIYAGSSDGYVYALMEHAGDLLWKFATFDPVIDSPVPVVDRVYAATELGGMYCIEAKTGKEIRWAPDILHFVAAGKQRVYAADKLGDLRILDARTGAVVDSLPASGITMKMCNGQTDRIYLASEGGMIQCLREADQASPIAYVAGDRPADELRKLPPLRLRITHGEGAAPRTTPKKPAVKKKDADAGFGDTDPDLDKPAKPAKGKAKGAAKKATDDDNPFGGS